MGTTSTTGDQDGNRAESGDGRCTAGELWRQVQARFPGGLA